MKESGLTQAVPFRVPPTPATLRPVQNEEWPLMITSAKLSGYRGFAEFSLDKLATINLLVGKNNSGKSSILEALHLLSSGPDLNSLWRIIAHRGEQTVPEFLPGRAIQQEADISHLFTGHRIELGSQFTIAASLDDGSENTITFRTDLTNENENLGHLAQFIPADEIKSPIVLRISGTPSITILPLPLTKQSTLRFDVLQQATAFAVNVSKKTRNPSQYVATESLSVMELLNLWNSISLTSEEDSVVKILQVLEPRIDRIAAISGPFINSGNPSRGGFVVRLAGPEQRIPIGSFGDGIWRVFALAVALSRSKDSILLVDEIDTGLHHTVMVDMWKFVHQAAKKLNVQVFATTHSYDCVHSLANICEENDANEIAIHRIETGSANSITFTSGEVEAAANNDIEVR